MELEHSLLRVPFERLSNVYKNTTKMLEKEIAAVVGEVLALQKSASTAASSGKPINRTEAGVLIGKLLMKLETLKKKVDEVNKQEEQFIQQMRRRLSYLDNYKANGSPTLASRTQQDIAKEIMFHEGRLNRMIVDHLLRNDHYQTAEFLAKRAGIQDLVEVELYVTKAKKIVESLLAHDCAPALAWCTQNKLKLKKSNNTGVELELRIQDFVLMVFNNKVMEAIQYARDQLLPFGLERPSAMLRVKHAMGILAFIAQPDSEIYQEFMSQDRWVYLSWLWKHAFHDFYGIGHDSPLGLTLQCGLAALKTPYCMDDTHRSADCPVCSAHGRVLAAELPFAHHVNSTIVCYITKKVMNEDNYPLVLPNGNAYCREAMEAMAFNNNGTITDPRSGETYSFSQLKRAFIT